MLGVGGSSPPWGVGVAGPVYPPLHGDLNVEVAVIGAGITGLTGAYLLARSGRRVAVLERDLIAGGETGRTTGFLTEVLDARLVDLVAVHGKKNAGAGWEGSRRGIDLVDSIVRELAIACEYRKVDAVLFGPRAVDRALLRREVEIARELGRPVDLVDPTDQPFPCTAAMRIPDQARLNPRTYMLGLARGIVSRGGSVHERTEVRQMNRIATGRRHVKLHTGEDGPAVEADAVLLASNSPFVDRRPMYSRLRPYRSYAVAGPVPRGRIPEGLFWNTLDPYDYARLDAGTEADRLILGGADHWVGQPGRPEVAMRKVLSYWKRVTGSLPSDPTCWSGQILNSEDGLPFIGRNPKSPTGEFIATGFGGNGLTLGTLAGWMFCERVLGRPTQWDRVFDPGRRSASTKGTPFSEKPPSPSKTKTKTIRSLSDLREGEGAWYLRTGRRIAVFRSADGSFRATDPTCTHLGCFVEWNRMERSWDCPCHGSRFDVDGKVLDGPAFQRLAPVELPLPGSATARPNRRKRSRAERSTSRRSRR